MHADGSLHVCIFTALVLCPSIEPQNTYYLHIVRSTIGHRKTNWKPNIRSQFLPLAPQTVLWKLGFGVRSAASSSSSNTKKQDNTVKASRGRGTASAQFKYIQCSTMLNMGIEMSMFLERYSCGGQLSLITVVLLVDAEIPLRIMRNRWSLLVR